MSDAEQFCQVCGAQMSLLQRVDAATSVVFEWVCANNHYWQQTTDGMTPIVAPTVLPNPPLEYEAE